MQKFNENAKKYIRFGIYLVYHNNFVQIPFKIASVLKALYFFPIVIVISLNLQNKRLKIFSSALLFLPLVEALLLGSRKPFFESVIILVFTIFIFSKVKKRITVFLMNYKS